VPFPTITFWTLAGSCGPRFAAWVGPSLVVAHFFPSPLPSAEHNSRLDRCRAKAKGEDPEFP